MVYKEKYLEQLKEIEKKRSLLAEEEHDILIQWKNDMLTWLDSIKTEDGCSYVKLNGDRYYCVEKFSSTFVRKGGSDFGLFSGVVGGAFIKGFSFDPTVVYIDDCFRSETHVDINTDIEEVSREEFMDEFNKTIDVLFDLSEENVLRQYERTPSYLGRFIENSPRFMDRENVKEMDERINDLLWKEADFL